MVTRATRPLTCGRAFTSSGNMCTNASSGTLRTLRTFHLLHHKTSTRSEHRQIPAITTTYRAPLRDRHSTG